MSVLTTEGLLNPCGRVFLLNNAREATLHDIAREIEFIAAVREGLAELDRGEGFSLDEIERELPAWVIR